MSRLVLVAAAALLAAGCGMVSRTPPAPTPADFPGIAADLALHGIATERVVSGEPGCDNQALAPTAIRFTASGLDQPKPATIYVYIFRNHDTWNRLRSEVDGCAISYVTDPAIYQPIAVSPYVVTSPDRWSPEFAAALRNGVVAAAGNGG